MCWHSTTSFSLAELQTRKAPAGNRHTLHIFLRHNVYRQLCDVWRKSLMDLASYLLTVGRFCFWCCYFQFGRDTFLVLFVLRIYFYRVQLLVCLLLRSLWFASSSSVIHTATISCALYGVVSNDNNR